MIRILICEDDPLFCETLLRILQAEPDMVVEAVAATSEELASAVEKVRFDVIVLDISLSGSGVEGLEFALEMQKQERPYRIVVLSALEEPELIVGALSYGGVVNYVPKRFFRDIPQAIRGAYTGRGDLHHAVVPALIGSYKQVQAATVYSKLTELQLKVLHLLNEGCTRAEISERLHYTPEYINRLIVQTAGVLGHRFPLFEKLRLRKRKVDTNDLVQIGKLMGIIS